MDPGPEALFGFQLHNSFKMPVTEIVISGIRGYLQCSVGGIYCLPIFPSSNNKNSQEYRQK